MNSNFTEAVSADTTAQEPVVKRHKRGDVREDGKIFWCYDSNRASGEWWMTPEEFERKREREKLREEARKIRLAERGDKTLRRGDVRADGFIFWAYGTNYRTGERWVTTEGFARLEARRKAREGNLKLPTERKHKRGDRRDDGKVFYVYTKQAKGGEYWVTPKQFEVLKTRDKQHKRDHPEAARANSRKRYSLDPLYATKKRLRCRVARALKSKGFKKNSKTEAMLGCTYEEFKAHIESKFLPGMSWANFSDCHIDHLVPCKAGKTKEQIETLFHYTNLRPMWGPENIAKSDTLPEENELPDNLHPKVREIWLTAASTSSKGYPA